MTINEFQNLIKRIYYQKDKKRGIDGSFRWLVEEIGELARCLRAKKRDKEELKEEFADIFAWLVSLASLSGINLEEAVEKYKKGCPRCKKRRCVCFEE
ncbi:MAG: MazG nucleotide pyrophosphohydrolase domain-containing protein [candidate division WOR-3 bacterium]